MLQAGDKEDTGSHLMGGVEQWYYLLSTYLSFWINELTQSWEVLKIPTHSE